MRDFAKAFYKSQAWKNCRAAYYTHAGGLCECCLAKGLYNPGVIVHHKEHINPDNITDPRILTDFSNLELLCRRCHAEKHTNTRKRFFVDELGRVGIAPHAV